ncbi:hypothetical protein P692DRAFT_20877487 [Suillus brevipes Sb2]|nr:hypothetical protein P692DRAFT_20877487 [Suillus brevipes Sb2]
MSRSDIQWVKAMIAHVPGTGLGDDMSDFTSLTDPFTTESLADQSQSSPTTSTDSSWHTSEISENHRPTATRTIIKIDLASCEARASATYRTRKRKIDDDDEHNANKENISLSRRTPAIKRICREKTGTEWQSVLDINKYIEEQLMHSKGTVTPTMKENSR